MLLSLRLISGWTIIALLFHQLFPHLLPSPSASAGQDFFTCWRDLNLHLHSKSLAVLSLLGHHDSPLTIMLLDAGRLCGTPEDLKTTGSVPLPPTAKQQAHFHFESESSHPLPTSVLRSPYQPAVSLIFKSEQHQGCLPWWWVLFLGTRTSKF